MQQIFSIIPTRLHDKLLELEDTHAVLYKKRP